MGVGMNIRIPKESRLYRDVAGEARNSPLFRRCIEEELFLVVV
jgi:hypothetical protein